MTHAHTECAPKDTETALAEAEALVAARGQKLTPIRRHVLRLLLDDTQPAKAYDLIERLDGVGAAKPPTIYRALDFLLEMDLAHKIESLNAYVACGHLSHPHAAIFLICDRCGAATELHAEDTLGRVRADALSAGFSLRRVVMEARGLCAKCRSETE
jgi:Fur family transcriptional regulator, zinc uptake regulator